MTQFADAAVVFFGPYRALLRALIVRDAKRAQALVSRNGLELSELLASEVHVKNSVLLELWTSIIELSENEPCLALEASHLFQFPDLGERGWLLSSARNFTQAIAVVHSFFSSHCFESGQNESALLCRWTPTVGEPSLISHYVAGICLGSLLGQRIPPEMFTKAILPKNCEPPGAFQVSRWSERFNSTYGLEPSFEGNSLEIHFNPEIIKYSFCSADDAVFEFFKTRCARTDENSVDCTNQTGDSVYKNRIRNILLSHIASTEFGAPEIAAELGMSVRTLERTLAREGISLRQLKQQLQRETAEEMLKMGVRAKEVASQVGFADVASFSRAFNRWTGLTPSQFRRQKKDEK